MRRIIYTRVDGGLSVVLPAINTGEDISEAEAEQRAFDKLPPDAINPKWINEADVPADRTYRNAWEEKNGKPSHNMVKARELHREILRGLRKPLLEAADLEFMKAQETGADLTAIIAKKQALRDVTKDARINAANGVEELKAAVPEILK